MKRFMRSTAIVLLVASFLFAACKKDKVIESILIANSVNDLPADTIIGIAPSGQPYGSGKFTFYNLETKSVVSNVDSATNKWDLGFKGTLIVTNSGNAGPGNAGAFVYVGAFGETKSVPADSTFKTENAPASNAIPFGSGKGWYSYNGAANLVTPIPGRLLIVRTAAGKYAKVEILNYYKGGITPSASASDNDKLTKQRYFTFRYLLQNDGSKNF